MSRPSANCSIPVIESSTGGDAVRLVMSGVEKRFGHTIALRGMDLVVQAGEVHALVGENGAGKSTLMKILSGVEQPNAGRLTFDGSPYRPRTPRDAHRAGIVMIYQELALTEHLSVEDNIVLGAELSRFGLIRRAAVRAYARAALEWLGHAAIDPATPVQSLPVAARQIVEIARATASGCRMLVLDEPTSSLARDDVERLFGVLRRLADHGCAIVYISHVLEEVKAIADRITVMRDGLAVAEAPCAAMSIPEIVTHMVGRDIGQLYSRSERQRGECLLSLQNLSAAIRPQAVSLELHAGEVFGIAGLVGSGRTELLRMIFGLDPVVSGRVRVGAWEGPAAPDRRLRQGLGMLSEDRRREGLATALSIADNMTLSRLGGRTPFGLLWPSTRRRAVQGRIDQLAIRCQGPEQRVDALSGGNQQKVALARLLHQDANVVLLDEPTRGIDVASKAQIYAVIDALATGDAAAGRAPRAVLVVSSYIPELLGLCDRIAVMRHGRLGRSRPVAQWTAHAVLTEATGKVVVA